MELASNSGTRVGYTRVRPLPEPLISRTPLLPQRRREDVLRHHVWREGRPSRGVSAAVTQALTVAPVTPKGCAVV